MLHMRSSLGGRKVSPPQPTCMTPDQKASYLADLRNNRPVRPTGSRPLPTRPPQPIHDENIPPRAESALTFRTSTGTASDRRVVSKEQRQSHRASMPLSNSYSSIGSQKGRPLVPSPTTSNRKVTPPSSFIPTSYQESTARSRDREEARALREALEELDHEEEEQRIHEAAKSEAADLVWRHCNPQLAEAEKTAAYRNPDLKKRVPSELHRPKRAEATVMPERNPRSVSDGSTSSQDSKKHRLPWLKKRVRADPAKELIMTAKSQKGEDNTRHERRKSSGKRLVSNVSSKGVFRNPEDEIYEEAEELETDAIPSTDKQLPLRPRQPNSNQPDLRPVPEKSYSMPLPDVKRIDRFEIWKNPPTQSRNAQYTASRALPQVPSKEELVEDNDSVRSEVLEIRGDDIRAATSMKRSDRSPKLPTPTAVSDRVGRPIVSFDPKWRAGTESPRNSIDSDRKARRDDGAVSYPVAPAPVVPEITIMEVPSIQISEDTTEMNGSRSQSVPTIHIGNESELPSTSIPSISIQETSTPVRPLPQISLPDTPPSEQSHSSVHGRPVQPSTRPLPSIDMPGRTSARPLPSHTQSSPSKLLPPSRPTQSEIASRVPWLAKTPSSTTSASATCSACSLPISGRIVTASGSSSSSSSQKARFHPECFTCHHCSTALECISFYPEPTNARLERLLQDPAFSHLDDAQVHHMATESNTDLHFFCHLDFHELFSPRCHTCKTPIEGAIVLALGRNYHPDRCFFCAECGDPFSKESPFVEHNNYAYCVGCHTKRTSARCRACKRQILDEMTIEALGGKWHDECFVCCDCGGDFGDEGRFFVREYEIELTEKERRKGYNVKKVEERAACQRCEERRVKNVNIFL